MTVAGLTAPTGLAALAPWLALAGLGAFHGVNPAMGWLFAVGLGLQQGRRGAVLRALHSGAMLAVAGGVALAVYEFVGVDFLRRAWLNLDAAWGAALVLAGAATLAW